MSLVDSLSDGAMLIVESSRNVPLVSIVIALRTGTVDEPKEHLGLARLAMRMLRRGTSQRTSRQIDEAIDSLGAELLVDTSAHSVALHGQVIARNVGPFVDLLNELLREATFPEAELARLKRETIAEIQEAMENDRALVQRAFQIAIFGAHPYSRSGVGTIPGLETIDRDVVISFVNKHVVRGNVIIGFSGDVAEDDARRFANSLVESIPHRPTPSTAVISPSPKHGRRFVFVDKPERTQSQIIIGGIGTHPRDPDHFALSVANAVFGGTFTSRLTREIRSKRGWSYGASSRLSIDRARQAFSMWTFPAAADSAACIQVELALLQHWVEEGVSNREVTFIKRYLTRSFAFDEDTANKRMHLALETHLLDLPADYYPAHRDHIASVTAETASNAIKMRIVPKDMVIAMTGTAADTIADVTAKLGDLVETTIVPFTELA